MQRVENERTSIAMLLTFSTLCQEVMVCWLRPYK